MRNQKTKRRNRGSTAGTRGPVADCSEGLLRDAAALTRIFSHLDSKSLVSVQQSCKLFNSVCKNNEVWRCVIVHYFGLIECFRPGGQVASVVSAVVARHEIGSSFPMSESIWVQDGH